MSISPLGREIDRVDGRKKVTGEARYAADHHPAGLAHAFVVTSTIAKGEIVSMDLAAATDAPGVIHVFHPDDNLGLRRIPQSREIYAVLENRTVHFYGQIIAVVVAESFEQARDAAALVRTTYRTAPAQTSLEQFSPGQVPPGAPTDTPPAATYLAPGVPTIQAALDASEVVVEARFHQEAQHHIAMEPHATVAEWNAARTQVTVHTGTQGTSRHTAILSARLGIAPTAVRVISEYVGGAFGSRALSWPDGAVAAAAAHRLGRPVKLVLSREQVFSVVGHRNAVSQTVKLGASRDGVLNAVSHECDAALPRVGYMAMSPALETSAVLYRTPNLHYENRQVALDLPPAWAMRAPSEAPGLFALETAMDELAVATGVDPVELRMRNYATAVPGTGQPWSSKHLDECYRIGARRFGWSGRRNRPRSRVDGDWLIGMGMASAIYVGVRRPEPVSVRVRLLADDSAVVSSATADAGTGSLTVMSIVGAHELGIPMRRVRGEIGDSLLPVGAIAGISAATASTVPGIHDAVAAAVATLKSLAVSEPGSPWHGSTATIGYRDGRLSGDGRSMTFGRLLSAVGRDDVTAEVTVQPGPELARTALFCFGAHFCEVKVNRFTGEPRVTRFTTVVDIGRVVNAQAARSQITGGVTFGIGHALLENDPIDAGTGRFAAATMGEYLVPVNADIPDIDVHLIDRPDPVINNLGVKGCGELGVCGSAAAVGNAVYNATGTRVRTTPITADKLF